MQPSDFKQDKYGKVIKGLHGYWAYIPNPLPPEINMAWDLIRELSEADRVLGELARMARMLPNPHLLMDPFVRREAVLSLYFSQTSSRDRVGCDESRAYHRPADEGVLEHVEVAGQGNPLIHREIRGRSRWFVRNSGLCRIEGTQASLSDLFF